MQFLHFGNIKCTYVFGMQIGAFRDENRGVRGSPGGPGFIRARKGFVSEFIALSCKKMNSSEPTLEAPIVNPRMSFIVVNRSCNHPFKFSAAFKDEFLRRWPDQSEKIVEAEEDHTTEARSDPNIIGVIRALGESASSDLCRLELNEIYSDLLPYTYISMPREDFREVIDVCLNQSRDLLHGLMSDLFLVGLEDEVILKWKREYVRLLVLEKKRDRFYGSRSDGHFRKYYRL
jgi:hypothetical protein